MNTLYSPPQDSLFSLEMALELTKISFLYSLKIPFSLLSLGIEPRLRDPQSRVLSVERREQ